MRRSNYGWKNDKKIKKLPAFQGRAAAPFYANPDEDKATYAAATKKLKEALCPPVERKNYYVKFEARNLHVGKDPSICKRELQQLLEKADPTLVDEAKSALLSHLFTLGLPSAMRRKKLEYNPTPTLAETLSFVQRYRAIEEYDSIFYQRDRAQQHIERTQTSTDYWAQ